MGETGVADNTDPTTIFLNPANAVGPPRAYLAASRMDWPEEDFFDDDVWLGRMNAGFARQASGRSMTWAVDVSLSKLDWGESTLTEPDGTPIGTVEVFEKVASVALAVSAPAGDRCDVRAGVAGKRWWAEYPTAEFGQDAGIVEADAYSFDVGVGAAFRSSAGDWRVDPAIAMAFLDAGPDVDWGEDETSPLPARFNFGIGLSIESPSRRVLNAEVPLVTVTGNVDGTHPREGDFEWGIGTEIAVAQILFLRSGTHITEQDDDDTRSGWGVGLGVPISSLRLRFDYTERDYNFSTKHMGVTASWLF